MGKREDTKKEIKAVCEQFLYEHQSIADFMSGFGGKRKCECQWCEMARRLLKEMSE